MFYDAKEVMQYADSERVAHALGLQIKQKGRNKSILCPGHLSRLGKADTHFGNAILTPKGYHCFGCGITRNVFHMVQEVTSCTFPEAITFVAKTTGQSFVSKKKEKKEDFLTPSDYELLGLTTINRNYNIIGSIDKFFALEHKLRTVPKNNLHLFNTEINETLLCENSEYYSLYQLQKEDIVAYKELIRGKAKEAIQYRKEIIEKVKKKQFAKEIKEDYIKGIITSLTQEIQRLTQIYNTLNL